MLLFIDISCHFCPIAFSLAFEKIISENEQSENDSANTELFFDSAKNYCEKLDALKSKIYILKLLEQKESMLKNINACFSEVESKYLLVLDSLPNTSDQDFLDIEKLKAKVDPVKAEADYGYQGK